MEDTIVAIATPPGEGGVGIVRLSGPCSGAILQRIFVNNSGKRRVFFEPRRLYLGYIVDQHERRLDQVLVSLMTAPKSFTGEDVVEINAHGGPLVLKAILELVLGEGARLAEPGEFTQRAFMSGKLDLMQAEAVIDVIRAKSMAALRQAERHLSGEFSDGVLAAREAIVPLLAQAAASIDFPEHDIPEVTNESILQGIETAKARIARLLSTSYAGQILRDGLGVVIVGKPNVGKSSLMNALMGKRRAIVTEVAGTTRDVIEDYFSVEGIPVRLVDTAGLRKTEDPVEQIGVGLAEEALRQADLVLVVLDGSSAIASEDEQVLKLTEHHQRMIVVNKCDLNQALDLSGLVDAGKIVHVSAEKGLGLDSLRREISELVLSGVVSQESPFVANARQELLLREALNLLKDAEGAMEQGLPLDMVEIDLREAYNKLGMMLGMTVSEDIMTEVFGRFCIGK